MNKPNINYLPLGALAILISTFLWIIFLWTSTPEVHFSTSTGACVRVVPPSAGTCTQLPTSYVHIWVH